MKTVAAFALGFAAGWSVLRWCCGAREVFDGAGAGGPNVPVTIQFEDPQIDRGERKQPPAVPPSLRSPAATPQPSPRPSLAMPIAGVDPHTLRSNFSETHGGHAHEALDIMAPRGTPVLAVAEGNVVKLFTSKQGGLTVYQFDDSRTWCYYYAHLDRYAPGVEGRDAAAQRRCAGLRRLHRRCVSGCSAPALRGLPPRAREELVARHRGRSAADVEVSTDRKRTRYCSSTAAARQDP